MAAAAHAAILQDRHDLVDEFFDIVRRPLSTARAQLVLGQLGLRSAERIFDLGAGSATSCNNNFDRHWRSIRTVLDHNPLLHKSRVVGDYLLNGTTAHLKEGKVF